jgi:hypothetical protein
MITTEESAFPSPVRRNDQIMGLKFVDVTRPGKLTKKLLKLAIETVNFPMKNG